MRLLTLLLGLALAATPAAAAPGGPIAVIVNPQNPVEDLSGKELKAAYEGYGLPGLKTQNIALVYLRGEIEDTFNLKVLGVSSKKVKVFWLRRVFEGESDLRKILKSSDEVKAFVGGSEACIGFLPAAEVDDSVKVISIDGKKHDDPGYLLR